MARIEIDTDKLNSADRQAFQGILLSEADRLEAEQRAARERTDAWDAAYIIDGIESEARERREKSAKVAEQARKRVSGAMANVAAHLTRAETPGTSKEVRLAEEGLALASLRRFDEWSELERRMSAQARVYEPDIYSAHSENSYFRDVAIAFDTSQPDAPAAYDRLERYATGLARDNTKAGLRARKVWREASRREVGLTERAKADYRAMSSGGASGGALVTPAYLVENWALYRSFVPSVAEACTPHPLPDTGMTVSVPAVSSGDPAPSQSGENTSNETDFSAGYKTVNLATYTGSTTVSQQLLERSGPVRFDQVVFAQLQASMWANIDLATINAMTAAATTNLTRATFTDMSSLWSDVNHAASTMETAPGVVLPATHAFIPPNRFRWFASQVDTQKRPIWSPDGGSAPDPSNGYTGYRIGQTAVYTDGSIPASGSNDVMLVANPASTLLPLGEPVLRVLPSGGFASSLGVVVQAYRYGAPVVMYAAACATITGAAYPTTVTWA